MNTTVVVKRSKRPTRTVTFTQPPKTKPIPAAKPQLTNAEKAAKQAVIQEQQRAEQRAAKQRRYEEARAMLDVFGEKWPLIFGPDAQTMPLKKHIKNEMIAALGEYSAAKVRRGIALYFYLVRVRYYKAIILGGPRFDLDGLESGTVTEAEQEHARMELEKLKGKRKGPQEGEAQHV